MVNVAIVRDNEGRICALRASGHAGGTKKGENLVCAASSILLRTFVQSIEHTNEAVITGGAPEPGELQINIEYKSSVKSEYFMALADFLVSGLLSLQKDFPFQVALLIQ